MKYQDIKFLLINFKDHIRMSYCHKELQWDGSDKVVTTTIILEIKICIKLSTRRDFVS